MYPLIGVGVSYLAYKLYNYYLNTGELAVIAPWHEEEERAVESTPIENSEPNSLTAAMHSTEEIPFDQMNTRGADELNLETVYTIIQSGLDLFSQANGPQLVALHSELRNPNLSSEQEEELLAIIEQLEQEAPALEQTVPPLLVYVSLLSVVENELRSQASQNTRMVNAEFTATMETIETIISYVNNYLDLYSQGIQADFMKEFNQQLERELLEYTQANTL
jgi:hypothetical protein